MTIWTPCPKCGEPLAATGHDNGCPNNTTARQLRLIIDKLKAEYQDSQAGQEGAIKAYAYGLAVGTLESMLREWERKLAGGDPSGA